MKKLLIAFCLMVGISGIATAQQATQKAPVKKEVKAPVAQEKAKPAAAVTSGPKKADGTLDKRFKENKGAAAGPVKKDGTPDKRYKANKKN